MKISFAIASQQDPFLSQVLKSKYFHNTSFLTAPKHSSRSLFWASILKIMPLLEENSTYQISQGNTIIWNSPWVQGWKNIHSLLQDFEQGYVLHNTILIFGCLTLRPGTLTKSTTCLTLFWLLKFNNSPFPTTTDLTFFVGSY
jgi:hypothetical protein